MIEKQFVIQDERTICDKIRHQNYVCSWKSDAKSLCKLLNKLTKDNKELKERNNRQCKRLGDLYQLIEEKDWRALTDIMDDFKRNDEQLQSEWQTYDDEND